LNLLLILSVIPSEASDSQRIAMRSRGTCCFTPACRSRYYRIHSRKSRSLDCKDRSRKRTIFFARDRQR